MKQSTINNQQSDHGFTLIEMLIYIAIIMIVVPGFIIFSLSISDARNKNYVISEVQANARNGINTISQTIRAATGVNISASTFDSDPGVLSLVMSDALKNPTIISLTADDGTLQITEGTDDPVSITASEVQVTNLVFTDLTSGRPRENIKIAIEVGYNNLGSDIEYDFTQSLQTAVGLRQ